MPRNGKQQIIRDAIRRFSHLGNKTIARYILHAYGELFENDLEKIRSRVRRVRGQNGQQNRERVVDKGQYGKTPVTMPQTWRKIRTPYKLPPGLWLVLSDLHVPYHEPLPLEAAIQYGHLQKVDGLFINGDFQDDAAVGFWYKEKRDFIGEIEKVVDMLDFLRGEFPKQYFVYKPGNHEYRLPRYYEKYAPELIGSPLAAMETMLGFEERNIEFLDYNQKVMAGELPIIHGHEYPAISKAVNAARGLFLKTKTFAACSHCHATSEHSSRDINDVMLTTWSFGCLCDVHPDWNPFSDWNWGCALINVEKDGFFEVENRRILHNGKVV